MYKACLMTIMVFLIVLLSGCAPPIYGVSRYHWDCMTPGQQQAAMIDYYKFMAMGCGNHCPHAGIRGHKRFHHYDGIDELCPRYKRRRTYYDYNHRYVKPGHHAAPQHRTPSSKSSSKNYDNHHSKNTKQVKKAVVAKATKTAITSTIKENKSEIAKIKTATIITAPFTAAKKAKQKPSAHQAKNMLKQHSVKANVVQHKSVITTAHKTIKHRNSATQTVKRLSLQEVQKTRPIVLHAIGAQQVHQQTAQMKHAMHKSKQHQSVVKQVSKHAAKTNTKSTHQHKVMLKKVKPIEI